jgi:spermidine synthase
MVPLLGCVGLAQWQDLHLMRNAQFAGDLEVTWSPYQKIEVIEGAGVPTPVILANGIGHQFIMPEAALRTSHYQRPHTQRAASHPGRPYGRVLVIGAGSGNDVAAALLNGATHVDAVEIDPVIADIGRRRNALAPYADPRVTLIIDDGRAMLTRAQPGYDLIIFALTDSLVKLSSVSTLRLENFLFTRESVRRAFALLAPDGDLYLYNTYREDWLVEKIGHLMQEATGVAPVAVKDGSMVLLSAGRASPSAPAPDTADVPTDDWPFLYLRERGIPNLYLGAMGVLAGLLTAVLGLLLLLQRKDPGRAPLRHRVAFLVMGAAFMLLETKSVIQFSLLFGTTWINNALVFLGVLLLVLLANRLVPLLPAGAARLTMVLLLAACLLGVVVTPSVLLEITSGPLRFLAAVLVMFSPVFFANVLFGFWFKDQSSAEHVFGWNLAGTTLGGVAEYASMGTGYTALALVVAALYVVVLLLMRAPSSAGTAPQAT